MGIPSCLVPPLIGSMMRILHKGFWVKSIHGINSNKKLLWTRSYLFLSCVGDDRELYRELVIHNIWSGGAGLPRQDWLIPSKVRVIIKISHNSCGPRRYTGRNKTAQILWFVASRWHRLKYANYFNFSIAKQLGIMCPNTILRVVIIEPDVLTDLLDLIEYVYIVLHCEHMSIMHIRYSGEVSLGFFKMGGA